MDICFIGLTKNKMNNISKEELKWLKEKVQ